MGGHVDLEKTKEMIDAYMEQGFSYFDTAWVYHGGFSEKIFGELVAKRYPREKFQVTSKMPVWELKQESDLERIFEEQLKKCNIEYLIIISCILLELEIMNLQKNSTDLNLFKK